MTFLERLTTFLKSAIIRQQLGMLILAVSALFGFAPDVEVLNVRLELIIAALLAIIPVLTMITRIFKPAPNLSAAAIAKEQELRGEGKINTLGAFPGIKQKE